MDTVKLTSQSAGVSILSGEEIGVFDGKCVEKSRAIVQKITQYASSLTGIGEHGSNIQIIAHRMHERQLFLEELQKKGVLSTDGETAGLESILNLMEEFQKEHQKMVNVVSTRALASSKD